MKIQNSKLVALSHLIAKIIQIRFSYLKRYLKLTETCANKNARTCFQYVVYEKCLALLYPVEHSQKAGTKTT